MRSFFLAMAILAGGCGGGADQPADGGGDDDEVADASLPPFDATPRVPQYAELWYSVDQQLVRVELDPASGAVVAFTPSAMNGGMAVGQNLITMLDDGSLLGARLGETDLVTHFYYIPVPPRDGSAVTPMQLGDMPDGLKLEGLYTDCDGRVYAMDSGVDVSSAEGNRLLRFTGDVTAGDFSYQVITDLATATVADIDDMGPAIVDNEIVDNPGLAIDSGFVHAFNFETGTGEQIAEGGTWGIHALGKELFTDGTARLYLLDRDAALYQMDPVSHVVSASLGTGPTGVQGYPGWSGLTGPLTTCDSGFVIP